jgi:hypothetical protein
MAYTVKTQQNDKSVIAYMNHFKEEDRYPDLLHLLDLMTKLSGKQAKMWGTQIIGFDSYKYKGKSTEGEWFKIGFAPRKSNISIYAISGFEKETELLTTLGKYKTGKGCMYVKRLSDIDIAVFEEFLKRSLCAMEAW